MFFFFSNFIPNKLVTFNGKDPPWMTSNLRDKIHWKNSIYKNYLKNGKTNYHLLSYNTQYHKYQ